MLLTGVTKAMVTPMAMQKRIILSVRAGADRYLALSCLDHL